MTQMKVELTLICCHDLDDNIKPFVNPFIQFTFHNKEYKTAANMNTTDPYYNKTFTLDVLINEKITFNVFSYKMLDTNILIGVSKFQFPSLFMKEPTFFALPVTPNGLLCISLKCVKNGIPPPKLSVVPLSNSSLLKITVKSVSSFARAYEEKYGCNILFDNLALNGDQTLRLEAKTMNSSMFTRITKMVRSDYYIPPSKFTYQQKALFVDVFPCDFIVFSVYFSDGGETNKNVLMCSALYPVPDFHFGEVEYVSLSSKNGTCFDIKLECMRSVYNHVETSLIPLINDKMTETEFPVEVYIEKIVNFEDLMQKKEYMFPSVTVKYANTEYKTSWLFNALNACQTVPEGWFQGFVMPMREGTEFTLRLCFREVSTLAE
ncbi:hypothetical protein EIN_122700, partial [Entamoeba invadens IP1]